MGRLGIGICYDIRFPELAQLYATRGVQLIVFPGQGRCQPGLLAGFGQGSGRPAAAGGRGCEWQWQRRGRSSARSPLICLSPCSSAGASNMTTERGPAHWELLQRREIAETKQALLPASLIAAGAFNMTTGPAHWELLQKARAVDNQLFVATCSPARR